MTTEAEEQAEAAIAAARAALRRRQGIGARYDSPNAPAADLDLARRGTAFFARKLNELTDAEFAAPSRLAGWTRAELIAHIGYNARALTRLTEWARTGEERPMYASPQQRNSEITLGGTLPTRALRTLFDHTAVHLNVEWRDLTDEQWDHHVRTAQGRQVPARETAWMRTKEVWIHAVDLGNGATFQQLPATLLERIISDVFAAWARRNEDADIRIEITDTTEQYTYGHPQQTIRGTLPEIARWLTGRGPSPDHSTGPAVPRWF